MTWRPGLRTRRGAYVALVLLTLVWGINWIAMKQALVACASASSSTSSARGSP